MLTFTLTGVGLPVTGAFTNPTICSPPNGTITISGLAAGASYTLYYTASGTPVSSVVTANASGQIIINGLAPGTYSGIYVTATGSGCTSNILAYTLTGAALLVTGGYTNPTACTPPDGTISINGLTPGGSYTLYYTESGTPHTVVMTATGAGQITITGLPPGVYTNIYVVSAASGCTSNILTYTLTNPLVPPAPVLTSNSPVCADSNLLLSATDAAGGLNYVWTGPNGFTSTSQTPIITNVQSVAAGIYSVTVTGIASGCSSSNTMNVIINPTPATPVLSANIPCQNGTLTMNASSNAGATYAWTGPAGFSSVLQNPSITPVTVANAGTYTVVAMLNGCPSLVGMATFSVYPTPPSPVVSDTAYCQKDPTGPLNATGTNLLWYTSSTGGTGSTMAPTPSSSVYTTLTWYVTQTVNGCESPRAPVTADILFLPDFSIAGNTTICLAGNTTLSYSGAPLAAANYLWSIPIGASFVSGSNTSPSVVVKFSDSAQYQTVTLTASDYNGKCKTTETVPVQVIIPPVSSFYINPNICVGDTITVALSYRSPSATVFAWDFAGADTIAYNSNSGGPYSLCWHDTGIHVIKLITTTSIGCVTPPVADTFTVHGKPYAKIKLPKTDICIEDTIMLSAMDDVYNDVYSWAPDHFFNYGSKPISDNKSAVMAIIEKQGFVTLTVTDPFGCAASDSFFFDPKPCCQVAFPNAFTPNAVDHNNLFRPIIAGYHRFHQFRIVNRWGQTVFECANSNIAWDGNYNGVPQDMDVYYYYLQYDCGGKTMEAKGDVTLIR